MLEGGDVPLEVEVLREASARSDNQLGELERHLDELLRDAESIAGDPGARRRAAKALNEIAASLGASGPSDDSDETGSLGAARGLLSANHYFRQWGRPGSGESLEEVDEYGLDRGYEARTTPFFEAVYRRWFRVRVTGVEHVPASGRALLVCNHSGAVPWDGVMLKMAVRTQHPSARELRWLVEDYVFHFPFLGAFVNRIGAVRACRENAERLLSQDRLVAVFPEGVHGIGKLYKQRYQLQRFGRGGHVKLAMRTGTPIIPTAVIGAEETNPLLFKLSAFTRLIGVPFVPITPTFPLLGPIGLLPLPARWHIVFGNPIDVSSHGPQGAEDAVLVNRLNEKMRATIQTTVDRALAERPAVFFGPKTAQV